MLAIKMAYFSCQHQTSIGKFFLIISLYSGWWIKKQDFLLQIYFIQRIRRVRQGLSTVSKIYLCVLRKCWIGIKSQQFLEPNQTRFKSFFILACNKIDIKTISWDSPFKGSLTQDFRHQIFFINQLPPGPWVSHEDHFGFFRKFAEIFAKECLSAMPTTPAKK